MRKPLFTDSARYPVGYTHAKATDIRKTWARERKRIAEKKAEKEQVEAKATFNVRTFKKAAI